MNEPIICECYLIDWSAKNGKYIHIESGDVYDSQKHGALDCQTKVKDGILNYGEYFRICKYIPGDSKSLFPTADQKIIEKIKNNSIEEGIPPISEKILKIK
tara:strand:- start:1006 stop:1308 length:303 start_codon:yes stop_codon:yes gene_type:complete